MEIGGKMRECGSWEMLSRIRGSGEMSGDRSDLVRWWMRHCVRNGGHTLMKEERRGDAGEQRRREGGSWVSTSRD